jgi:hypothetical protein
LPKLLSENELGKLFKALTNKKHKALLFTAYSAGLRVSEIVNLKIKDIDSSRMQIFIGFMVCEMGYSQYKDLGSWNILSLKYSLNDKWSLSGETQLRSLQFYHQFHYYEYKGSVNYRIHPNLKFTVGAGRYVTYKQGGNFVKPKNNDEFRLWPQVILNHSIWNLKVEQRYRAEKRFTSYGYRNRFRYRLGLSYPFGSDKKGYKPFQLNGSNELFFTDREPYFERNRLLFSLNYKTSKIASLQLGYLHQFDCRINDETGRDFLVLGIFFEFNRKQKQKQPDEIEIRDN